MVELCDHRCDLNPVAILIWLDNGGGSRVQIAVRAAKIAFKTIRAILRNLEIS